MNVFLLKGKWRFFMHRQQSEEIPQREAAATPLSAAASDGQHDNGTHLRILHLSDVHFGTHFDVSVWDYITALVRRERPDVVVCTGDLVDHGGLFMLATAKQQFEQLRRDSGVNFRARYVPGNHDCGPWGNLRIWPFSSNFAAVFGPRAMVIDAWVPSYWRYRSWFLPLRWLVRPILTIWLYGRKTVTGLVRRVTGAPMSRLPVTRNDDPAEVVFMYLDSNHQAWLASGNVDVQEVMRLKSFMLNMRDIDGSRSFAPRIALVHHHPLPIPDAKITEGLTSFEPFLVLRNAGVLLRELNRCDVDLVLHGHKHYASFTRLGYSLDHGREGEIAVLAAGSAGVTHSEQGRNSVNFVDVFRSGRMAYTSIYFGGGAGEPVTELFRSTRHVHGMQMHKMRMHRRATERQGQRVEKVTHHVAVDSGGVALVTHNVYNHHFVRDLDCTEVPLRIRVSMGRVPPTTLKLSEASLRAGHDITHRPRYPQREIACNIDLGLPLVTASMPANYGYSFVSFNTYAVTEWETVKAAQACKLRDEKRGRVAGMESSSLVVRVPVDKLVFRLTLPRGMSTPDPLVRVMRWCTYPDVPLDKARHFLEEHDEAHQETGWVYDADTTEHEATRLSRSGENEWQLLISNPLVGHRYEIRWRVRDAVENDEERGAVETERRGVAEAYRQALLTLETHAQRKQAALLWVHAFLAELCRPSFVPTSFQDNDDLEVAMFAYDDAQADLRLVLTSGQESMAEKDALRVPLSEGIVGAAMKRTAVVCYVDPQLSGSRDDAAYLYEGSADSEWPQPEWKFVVAFPIFAARDPFAPEMVPLGKWSPAATVGVLTIASKSPASGLVRVARSLAAGERSWDFDAGGTGRAGIGAAAGKVQRPDTTVSEGLDASVGWTKIWAYAHIMLDVLENPAIFTEGQGDQEAVGVPAGESSTPPLDAKLSDDLGADHG